MNLTWFKHIKKKKENWIYDAHIFLEVILLPALIPSKAFGLNTANKLRFSHSVVMKVA